MPRKHRFDSLYEGGGEPHSRPSRADAVSNRERLLVAAKELFAESGALTTMELVAERAGVGKGTAYRSFPNRDALVAEVAVRQYDEVRDLVLRELAHERPLGETLVNVVHGLFEYNRRNSLYVEIDRLADPPPALRHAQIACRAPIIELFEECGEAGLVRPEVVSDDLFNLTIAYTLAFGRKQLPAEPWRRAAWLTLLALGYPYPA